MDQTQTKETEWPLLTVIVTCYNHERYVEECLNGVLAQKYPRLQLIICDDCSSDNSCGVITDWLSRHRVEAVFIKNPTNRGVCATLNDVLALIKGKYVALIDSDDVWLPEKSVCQIVALENADTDVGVLYSDALRIDADGNAFPESFIETTYIKKIPQGWIYESLLKGNYIPGPTSMIKRECFDVIGPFDCDLFVEDWDLWLRIAKKYKYIYGEKPVAKYRWLATSVSRTKPARVSKGLFDTLVKHIRQCDLTTREKKVALITLPRYAIELYETGASERCEALWITWRLTRKPAVLAMYLSARMGFTWTQWNTFKNVVESFLKRRINNPDGSKVK